MAIGSDLVADIRSGPPLRAAIADCLDRVVNGGGSLDRALEQSRALLANPRDQGFLQECVYGCLRQLFSLRAQLGGLLQKPLRKKDAIVECVLLAGLYQLESMATPAHATINESVTACTALDRDWARGLVNAVLRNAQRRAAKPAEAGVAPESGDETRFNHPQWLIGKFRKAWPLDWADVLVAGNAHPPMTLRVNRLQTTREEYLTRLVAVGLNAVPSPSAPHALLLERPVRVTELPGFDTGAVSVQDAAAQLAAPLLEVRAGQRILDACAAPGGKALHLLELSNGQARLLAIDNSAERLQSVAENLQRAGLTCGLLVADASTPASWWDGEPFERILLDAPCSGTGVIRRHPDIKLHRQPDDLAALVETQRALLEGLWPTLAPGGRLLYVTCSVLPAENEQVLAAFNAAHADCTAVPIAAGWGRATVHGRQILTGEHEMDGFFFGLLQKHAHA